MSWLLAALSIGECALALLLWRLSQRIDSLWSAIASTSHAAASGIAEVREKTQELEKGLKQATKLAISANAHSAKAHSRCDGITGRIKKLTIINGFKEDAE